VRFAGVLFSSSLTVDMWPLFASLGSPWMLIWGLAALIPVVIHLWNRRHHESTDWAAMRFLRAAVSESIQRIRIRQYLLLVLRATTLIVFAVALADPRSSGGSRSPSIDGPTHFILVIDDSYSMDQRSGNSTCLQLAKEYAAKQIHGSRDGDGFSIITMSSPVAEVIGLPSFDRAAIEQVVRDLAVRDTSADLDGTITVVTDIIHRTRRRFPEFRRSAATFLTDMQHRTWHAASTNSVRDRFSELNQLASVEVAAFQRGAPTNLTIQSLRPIDGFPTARSPVTFEIPVANHGDQAASGTLELLVAGQPVDSEKVELPPGEVKPVLFTYEFSASGEQQIEARLSRDDVPHDNRRFLSLPIRESIDVLCVVDAAPAARYLEASLRAQNAQTGPLQITVSGPPELARSDRIDADCIFFMDVGRFEQRERERLTQCLRDGTGLVFMLGSRVDAGNYNEVLGSGPEAVLPVQIDALQTTGPYFFDPRNHDHSITRPFAGFPRAGLTTVPTWKYFRLVPQPSRDIIQALWFTGNDPAIVEADLLGGRVIVVATPAYDRPVASSGDTAGLWTAWPLSPSFPPTILKITERAVQAYTEQRNTIVGNTISASVPPGLGRRVTVNTIGQPERSTQVLADPRTRVWNSATTRHAGFYAASYEDRRDAEIHAVNIDTSESRCETVAPTILPADITYHHAGMEHDRPRTTPPAPDRRLFRWALAAAAGLLMGESLFALYAGKSR
jgi:hypothetical protein